MALVRGVNRIDMLVINTTVFDVEVESQERVRLLERGSKSEFLIQKDEWVQVMPQVYITLGSRVFNDMVRLVIEAPKEVIIHRNKDWVHESSSNS